MKQAIRHRILPQVILSAVLLLLSGAGATAQLHHFAVGASGGGPVESGTALTPLFIQVIAQDSTNTTVTSFTGTVEISSNGTLSSGGGTTAPFTGGILGSHSVNFASGGSFYILAVNSVGAETGVSDTFIINNPLPQVTSIIPSSRTAGDSAFTLTVRGAGFTPASGVSFDGDPLATTFVDDSTVTAFVSATHVDTAGSFEVSVESPAPGGGSSTPATFEVLEPVLSARAILEGAYSGGAMSTQLRASGLVPLAQPFSGAPWNYGGGETVGTVPAGVVDWVLLSLRAGTARSTRVSRRAAFLKSDGTIVDLDGSSPVSFPGVGLGSYYVVVRHRNHIPAMTATARPLNAPADSCDFTAAPSAFFGGKAKSLAGGKFGLYAGDFSADGFIDIADFAGPDNTMFQSGYRASDLSLDGFIDAADFAYPDNNLFVGSNVPE